MMIKYAIALAIVIIVAASAAWAFLPSRHLPGNRARHLRIRLHLRLTRQGLRRRRQPVAALGPPGRAAPVRPDPPRPPAALTASSTPRHSVFLGRAHYRPRLHVPLEEHLLVMAPPRTFKTAPLCPGRSR